MKHYKVLFCDLDGTLINTLSGKTFPEGIWDMSIKLNVLDHIKNLNPDYVFIVTNQGGIGKFVSKKSFEIKLSYIEKVLHDYLSTKEHNITTYAAYCHSMDKENPYRKPNPGMLEHLVKLYHLDIKGLNKEEMLMIGDASGKPGDFSDSDKKAAENFGIDYLDVNDFIKSF